MTKKPDFVSKVSKVRVLNGGEQRAAFVQEAGDAIRPQIQRNLNQNRSRNPAPKPQQVPSSPTLRLCGREPAPPAIPLKLRAQRHKDLPWVAVERRDHTFAAER
jgi:hypothetical protein